ncbi:MAG: DNA polymerase III subunit gamma/tau [Spirochaetales bacterium]|nr:DNA polymerase III subunit gamma/tau [Spirochaetales bacterium]
MAYEVTATRKRPRSFEELTGQEFVVETLKKSLKSGQLAQAFLFSGSRGVGKTSMARILAKSLNCEKGPTAEPCGVCSQCQEIARGASLDVIEIDGASNTSVNDVREIKDEVLFAPSNSKYKVYIIDEVHMLSNSAFNALLKTIEEPPPYVVFIFATTELHKVPATIKSRCQQYHFRLIDVEVIKSKLLEAAGEQKLQVDEEALYWIAKESTGSMRDAYTLFDQIAAFSDGVISLEKIREKLGLVGLDQMNQIVDALALGQAREAVLACDEILASGVSVEQFIMDLAEYFRSLLFFLHNIDRESLLGFHPDRFSAATRTGFSPAQVEKALELLLALYRTVRYSLNQRYELELLMSRLARLKEYSSNSELVTRLEALKASLASGWTAEGSSVPPDDEKKKY